MGNVNWEWYEILKQLNGRVVEVETEHLFKDQFNIPAQPDIQQDMATGFRVMGESVEEVINDVRRF